VGNLYIAVPVATSAPFDTIEVQTGTALKTVLQVVTPSTTDIRLHGWGLSFKGVVATGTPGECHLIDTDVAATVTSLTPGKWESQMAPSSLCVGGTEATGYNATAEDTITAIGAVIDAQDIHPQTGYGVWFPEGRRPKIAVSRVLRVRTLFAVDVACLPWVVWEEPA
jgi:hypothetical protein